MDSDDSNPNRFEIRVNDRAKPSSSQLTRKRDDEEDVSDKEARLIRRKRPKSSTTTTTPEIDEMKLSYRSDWDALYSFIRGSIVPNFSKVQLRSKVRKLKKRFTDNLAKSEDGKGPDFTNVDDDEIFKLSMIIWGKKNETECGSNENLDQGKDVTSVEEHEQINENVEQEKDLTDVEHEQINENVEKPKDLTDVEHEQINENVEHEQINENVEKPEDVSHVTDVEQEQINENVGQAKDVPNVEHEQVSNISTKIDNGEKEKKSETAGVDEFCVMQDALEAALLSFPCLGRNHQKFLLQNLRNLEAEKEKELSDEWKALLGEKMKFNIKKLNFSAKLADVGGSD
ncbi:unnamed protein product [Arabis nemorensis]|uniref:Glabrous enhancer-binding protein-like DBD domain-containing protein n=1 Tax=Arabis nemorensis TaxID=586526 RepID=A0A565BJ22_9BRAS|nr:unnamed protein product [Arabis nemorensis]